MDKIRQTVNKTPKKTTISKKLWEKYDVANSTVEFKVWQLVLSLLSIFLAVSAAGIGGTWTLVHFSIGAVEKNIGIYLEHQKKTNEKLEKNIDRLEDSLKIFKMEVTSKINDHSKLKAHEVMEERYEHLKSISENYKLMQSKLDILLNSSGRN